MIEKAMRQDETRREETRRGETRRDSRFDFGDVFGVEAVGDGDVVAIAITVEQLALEDQRLEQLPHHLAEIHAADHLLVQLAPYMAHAHDTSRREREHVPQF